MPHPTPSLSPLRLAWEQFCRNRLAPPSLLLLIILILLSILVPILSPYTYTGQNLAAGATPPSAQHWIGTDDLGRDLLVRLFTGGRVSLAVGLCATTVALLVGTLYGATAGFAGGWLDAAMMRLVDILYALPFTLLVILLMVFCEQPLKDLLLALHAPAPLVSLSGFLLIFLSIGLIEWLTMARIVRAQVMSLTRQPFIEAARALGAPWPRILLRHLIPNALGPIIVYAALTIPQIMVLEATLSFLGLGIQPPMSSWGLLIRDGATSMEEHPWLILAPGLLFASTLFALNTIGSALRDALDPRSAK